MSVADVALSPIRQHSRRSPGFIHTRIGLSESNSIVIYLTVTSSVIPMRVLESDSIAFVKLRIHTCKGCVVRRQKLVYGGRELARNNYLVKDYGVKSGSVLHLILRLSDLLVINVRTTCGKEFEFQVDRFRNVGCLKQKIAEQGKGFVDAEEQDLFFNGEKLNDQILIDDVCKNCDGVIHLVVQKSAKVRSKPVERNLEISVKATKLNGKTQKKDENRSDEDLQVGSWKPPDKDFLIKPIIVSPKIKFSSVVWDIINSVYERLEREKKPIRSPKGTGGTYFMQHPSGNKYVAVFKPIDEEPMAVNNPQGLPLSSDGQGIKRGRGCSIKTVDHPKSGPRELRSQKVGFANVPPTMVQCLHRGFNHPEGYEGTEKNIKTGSLQMFMKNSGNCEDMGPRDFPVEEVHKISLFDIRTANTHRHAGNILMNREEGEECRIVLIPIDHGYCLPENFEDCTFDWFYWPQAKQPYSSETLAYIKSLDAEKDIELLKVYGWDLSLECSRTFRNLHHAFEERAERGLSPFSIGSIMCRETLNKES